MGKIIDIGKWKGESDIKYVAVEKNDKTYLFTPREIINARARWIGNNSKVIGNHVKAHHKLRE